ncbi:reverse transcriptase-like protein [Gossypium australe]|uniref:Reverse transcriptase-like protein n=1 Tax=Gossypium australe TaxID=47621 RepID=A0A5B6WQS9_9ROSI|nr:reverse transcriptase-like protein [Gossypium australe]
MEAKQLENGTRRGPSYFGVKAFAITFEVRLLWRQQYFAKSARVDNRGYQRRLNAIMKEVIKKDVIMWLYAGIIYPISNSSWVSHIQCVPKKGGIIVVSNDNNELIPTHTVIG